jgi:hypothetical protein
MNPCARTGEKHCRCLQDRKLPMNTQKNCDLKSLLRKLFTDHGVYTALVIKSITSGLDDVSVLLPRLLQNQKDIGDNLKPIIGEVNGNKLTQVLTEHIKLAGEVIKASTAKSAALQENIDKLFDNSDKVAEVLSFLNPRKLPLAVTQKMFEMHNEFVVAMTKARLAKKYQEEIELYDAYYNEILEMSDMIYNALI